MYLITCIDVRVYGLRLCGLASSICHSGEEEDNGMIVMGGKQWLFHRTRQMEDWSLPVDVVTMEQGVTHRRGAS